jgi:asparagine synthase (glutamine-hydrolysing)
MSGIFGLLQLAGDEVSARQLERMSRALAHLGPDRSEFRCDASAGMGTLLMHVTREDTFDVQPLRDVAAGLTLVGDVRLDNREELATALSIGAETLRDMADSTLLLAAWKKWRAGCVDHLIGDFVFAVWDAGDKTLTIARDHMGQRHVFYHQGEGFFAFASEIKGLRALPQVPRILLEEKMARHFLRDEPDDPGATDYGGIRAIPGGTVLTLNADGTISTRRYWEPHADPAHEGRDEAYYIETYRKVLAEAVACRLRRAIAPAGLFMGGGFDSGAICALAGPVVSVQGRKFIAVSSVMPEDYCGSIQNSSRRWCEMCRRVMPYLDMRYVTREGLDVFTFMEQGFLTGDNRHSPNRYVTHAMFAELAKARARVVMDGHGGDYTVNPRGQNALARMLWKGQFCRFVAEFKAARRHLHLSVKQTLVRHVLLKLVPVSWMRLWINHRKGLALFGPTMPLSRALIRSRDPKARPRRRGRTGENPRGAMLRVLRGQQNFPAQAYSVSAAAHGLEFTQPFHDKRVVEFGLAIPEELYFKDGKTRHLARAALKDLYPPEYQDRPTITDGMLPDFLTMAKRIEPRVLAEIDRMEKAGYLSRYFDFPRMRKMLTRRTIEQHNSGAELDTRQAMLTFIAARYIEWFRGDNR